MSMTQVVGDSNIMYLSIIGGSMVQKSEEGVEGAKKREYETSDGKKGIKWEISHKNLTGRISGMEFKESDYGEQFILKMNKGDNNVQVQIGTDSRYFMSFGRTLPNINLEEEVEVNAYDFKTKEGKRITGMSIKQEGTKVNDFYRDGKKACNGIPTTGTDNTSKYDNDDWKVFFVGVKKFLKAEVLKVELPSYTPVTASDAKDVFDADDLPDFE